MRALSCSAQDDAAGWADTHDGAASPFAELDSGVLYRAGGTAKARALICTPVCHARELTRVVPCAQAPTFTPRLVVVDASGALGGVSSLGGEAFSGDADAPPVVASWGGAAHVVRREAVPKSDFVRALEAEAAEHHEADAPPSDESDDDDDERPRRRRAQVPATPAAPSELGEEAEQGESAVERGGAALEGRVAYWSDYAKAVLHPRSTLLLPGVWHGVHAFKGYGESREFAQGDTGEDARDRIRRAAPLISRAAHAC